MWNVLRKLFKVPEPTGTVVRLDDFELREGDKFVVLYPGMLSPKQRDGLRDMLEDALANDRKRVLIFDSGARLQVVRKGSKLHKLMDGKET